VNQEESEHYEVDGMKKGTDSTGKVMQVKCVSTADVSFGLERLKLKGL